MPIRTCDHCHTRYVVGVNPGPGSDIEQCRLCGEALKSAVPKVSRSVVLPASRVYASETAEEENQRLRDELQTTRLRSQQLRSDARKGRQALDKQVQMSRAARATRAAPPVPEE